jgi:hypothetical protein
MKSATGLQSQLPVKRRMRGTLFLLLSNMPRAGVAVATNDWV